MNIVKRTKIVDLSRLTPKQNFISGILARTEPTQEEIITKEIEDSKRFEEEQKLMNQQLALPPSKRNKALMQKFNIRSSGENVDGYRYDDKFYHYTCFFKEDKNIPAEYRPENYWIKMDGIISSRGDQFTFMFPISRIALEMTSVTYKIDNMLTYLDSNLKVINDQGIFDIYPALLNWKSKNHEFAEQITSIFLRYKILQSLLSHPNDIFNPLVANLDFRITGYDISVSHTEIKQVLVPITETAVGEEVNPAIKRIRDMEERAWNNDDPKTFFTSVGEDELVEFFDTNNPQLNKIYSNATKARADYLRVIDSQNTYSIIDGVRPGMNRVDLEELVKNNNDEFILSSKDIKPKTAITNGKLLDLINYKKKFYYIDKTKK